MKFPHCTSSKNKKFSKKKVMILVLLVVVIMCLIFSICFIIFIFNRKRFLRENIVSTPSLKHQFLRVSYSDLVKATNGFSKTNLLGSRSCSSVHKGELILSVCSSLHGPGNDFKALVYEFIAMEA